MRLLLDTHIALWAITGDKRLPQAAATLIENPHHVIFISAASLWEITIKYGLAKGRPNDMPVSGPDALIYFRAAGYRSLPVTAEHAITVTELPDLHRDPFDRLLVAQARHEPLRLLTHDPMVKAYGESIMLF